VEEYGLKGSWKKLAAVLAFIILGIGGVVATAQSKTSWYEGVPKAIRGIWVSKEYKRANGGSDSLIISNSAIGNAHRPVYYHHEKGSQYYYVKTSNQAGTWTAYTWYKVENNKLITKVYGEKNSAIQHGNYHTTPQSPIKIWHRK